MLPSASLFPLCFLTSTKSREQPWVEFHHFSVPGQTTVSDPSQHFCPLNKNLENSILTPAAARPLINGCPSPCLLKGSHFERQRNPVSDPLLITST